MEFTQSYYSKSTIKKKKKYEFYFTKEDIDEGMKRNFDNPHYCKQGGNKSFLSVLFGLYQNDKGELTAVMYHSYHVFSELK